MMKKKNNNMKNEEYHIYKQIATYMRYQYPKVIFTFDQAGLNLSKAQAGMNKAIQGGRGWPDFFIARPKRFKNGEWYHGLFIEIKKDGTKLKREKNGTKILKGDTKIRLIFDWFDKHIEEQADMLYALEQEGYKAVFAVGYDEAVKIIDLYLKSDL